MNQRFCALVLVVLATASSAWANTCRRYTNDFAELNCEKKDFGTIVEVLCKTVEPWSNLPTSKLHLYQVKQMKFCNCSFSEGLDLFSITQNLGVENIEKLEFESSRSALRPEHVKGFKLTKLSIVEHEFSELDNTESRIIPDGFLKDLAYLKHLEITKSHLEKLRANDFSAMESVEVLHLHDNRIEEIGPGTFDRMVDLKILELSNNRLKTLPSTVFRKLSKLEKLNLSGNDLDELPSDLLLIPNSKLQRFRLNNNRGVLKSLPGGFFKALSNLNEVFLINSNFISMPEDTFQGTKALQRLIIKQNKLVDLPAKLFEQVNELKELNMSENLLESLPEKLFENTSLEILDMSHNRITNLSSDILDGLTILRELYLSHNNLSYIGHDICNNSHIRNVKKIDLSYNELTLDSPENEPDSVLQNCVHIVYLNMSHNNIRRIFNDWGRNTNLRKIDLTNNKLTSISALDLHIMTNHKTELILNNNEIATVNLTEIEYYDKIYRDKNENRDKDAIVYMENNPLKCDCNLLSFFLFNRKMLSETVNRYMTIHKNNLKCASPPEFENQYVKDVLLDDLKCLVQSNIEEDACNETCTCLSYPYNKVLSVDCSHKNLSHVPLHIDNPQNFSIHLDISGNKLQETPSLNNSYLRQVTSLDLSSNNISVIAMDVFPKGLRDLKLHNNNISRLDSKVVACLTEDTVLRNLTLHNNKWICDCEARDFIRVVRLKLLKSFEVHEVMCYGTNRQLITMTENELCPSHVTLIVSLSLTVALIGIAAGVMAALYYKNQKKIKIWLYSKQWCLWFVTEDELDKDKKYDAFISYSHKDDDFVDNELVPNLENGSRPYKLCLHQRDWLAGEWIPAQIARSVDESRRTIIVLSPNFLESVWGGMEFRTAHSQALSEGRTRVIVILYGDIGNTENLDPELKAYLSMNTYVKWGDPWFWDKLRYALPHRYESSKRKSRNARIIEKHMSQLPLNNHGGRENEIIPMPEISSPSNDSSKLLDSNVEDEGTAAPC